MSSLFDTPRQPARHPHTSPPAILKFLAVPGIEPGPPRTAANSDNRYAAEADSVINKLEDCERL